MKNIKNQIRCAAILFALGVIMFASSSAYRTNCLAQMGWPAYTQNVLSDPLLQYIQAATFPGSIIVSGCWGYPWYTVPGDYPLPSNSWSSKSYYMFYPPIGWFDNISIYPFWHIYNVADVLHDFPNVMALVDSPAMWKTLSKYRFLFNPDPLSYYLAGGVNFFSGAVLTPYLIASQNNPGIDPAILKYLSLMGLFDYAVPERLITLPTL